VSSRAETVAMLSDPDYRLEHAKRSEMAVSFSGPVAVVSSRWVGHGTYRGQPFKDDNAAARSLQQHRRQRLTSACSLTSASHRGACLLIALILVGVPGAEAQRHPSGVVAPPTAERSALGAVFVGGNASGLRALLHADLVVQPPSPDSALRGPAGAAYLTGLAAHTRVTESRLEPQVFFPEGPFLLEQGTWVVRAGERVLGSRYHLRWRRTPAGWKVVLWRWTRFR
jgi:hypothetical protein